MTKPKLRGSWDVKIEAQAGLGVAKPKVRRAPGSTSGRSGVTLGGLRAGLGKSRGVRGGPQENFETIDFLKIDVPCAA